MHLLFQNYPVINIIQEGMATWLGGSSYNISCSDAIAALKTLPFSDKQELGKIVNRTPPYWQGTYTYAIGAVVMEYAYNNGGIALVKEILNDNQSKDIYEIIQKHFNIGDKNHKDFLIELIQSK